MITLCLLILALGLVQTKPMKNEDQNLKNEAKRETFADPKKQNVEKLTKEESFEGPKEEKPTVVEEPQHPDFVEPNLANCDVLEQQQTRNPKVDARKDENNHCCTDQCAMANCCIDCPKDKGAKCSCVLGVGICNCETPEEPSSNKKENIENLENPETSRETVEIFRIIFKQGGPANDEERKRVEDYLRKIPNTEKIWELMLNEEMIQNRRKTMENLEEQQPQEREIKFTVDALEFEDPTLQLMNEEEMKDLEDKKEHAKDDDKGHCCTTECIFRNCCIDCPDGMIASCSCTVGFGACDCVETSDKPPSDL